MNVFYSIFKIVPRTIFTWKNAYCQYPFLTDKNNLYNIGYGHKNFRGFINVNKEKGISMKSILYNETFTRISEEKRNKILQTATNEFAEHGFESANINTIAKKSGISIGAMYSYFNSKENLFITIIQYAVETLKSVLDEIMLSDHDLLFKLEKIIQAIQLNSRENVQLTKLYGQLTAENRSDLISQIVSDMESVSADIYTKFLEQAQNEKIIRDDINVNLFAFFLDNLFITLQFSYSCEYYKKRMKIFVGEDIFENDDLVAEQLLEFIKSAFLFNV